MELVGEYADRSIVFLPVVEAVIASVCISLPLSLMYLPFLYYYCFSSIQWQSNKKVKVLSLISPAADPSLGREWSLYQIHIILKIK